MDVPQRYRGHRGGLLSAVVLLGAVALVGLGPQEAPEAKGPKGRCDKVLNGGDHLQRFVNRLNKGQTGCLSGGNYSGGVTISKPHVTLKSRPGQRATILGGQVRINATAKGATLLRLKLYSDQLSPLIYASHAVVSRSTITNDHRDICLTVDKYPGAPTPKGVRIEKNRIHGCGRLPATNFDHGIYITQARGTLIRRNLIYDNADRGIQLYPHAHGTKVVGNVIDNNGEGVLFGGASARNTVTRNIISNSRIRHNAESADSSGRHNVVRKNCVWTKQRGYYSGKPKRSGIMGADRRFRVSKNRIRNPRHSNGYKSNRC